MSLSKLEKIQKASQPERKDSDNINSSLKDLEQQITRKMTHLTNKLNLKIDALEANSNELKKEISLIPKPSKSESLSESTVKKMIFEAKSEINNDFISPLDFEIKENYKTLTMLDQLLKLQTWNIEASLKEFNTRFDVHREKIVKIENIAKEFEKEVDGIILKQISPLKEMFLEKTEDIQDLYEEFKRDSEEIIKKLNENEVLLKNEFKEALAEIFKYKADADKALKNIVTTNGLHLQKLEYSISQAQIEMENLKCEVLISQRECYDDAKNDLMKCYRKDLTHNILSKKRVLGC